MDAMINMDEIWRQYGLDKLQQGLQSLFPEYGLSLQELLGRIWEGDLAGALSGIPQMLFGGVLSQLAGMRNVFVWLLVLGLVSAVTVHFMEIFDWHQIADLGFYFMYLLLTAVLLQCFRQAAQTAEGTLESIVTFIKLMVPTYLMSVGIAAGAATVGGYYQLLLLVIFGVEQLLAAGLLPFIYSYCILAVVGGVWVEEKLTLLMDLLGRGIRAALKAAVGVVTGVSVFQSMLTPMLDFAKTSLLQKVLSAIPGVGNTADGIVELVLGSAVMIKNSIGLVLLLLLILLCAAPLLQVLLLAGLLKIAAALMGLVSDPRITAVTDRVGESGMLLFRTVGTALLLFLITLSMMAVATNRGI